MKLWLTIAYDGRRYCGWQAQDNAPSVQRTLTRACESVYGVRCLVTGCSRTDSGVHAREYSCTVAFADAEAEAHGDVEAHGNVRGIEAVIPVTGVARALNSRLPEDIAVIRARIAEDGFHPRYDVRSKTYEYVFHDGDVRSPFLFGRAYHTRRIDGEALARMDAAARAMTGRRDFAAFMAAGSKITDTVRTVYDCSVHRDGELVIFRVSADGFLYKMVRTMAGTALAAARGRIAPEDVENIIAQRKRQNAKETLPAEGLYLCRVDY